MLRIRTEQMKVFRDASLRQFEDEMVQHLWEFSPRHCEVIREDGVRQVVRLGIGRAEAHGLTNRGPVRFYIELMYMFGSDFDTDPQLPWAAAVLEDPAITGQMERAERLHDKMTDYLEKVAGPDNAYTLEALRGLRHAAAEGIAPSKEDLEVRMLREMKGIYPEKCATLGDPRLREAVGRGRTTAEKHSVRSDRGVELFVVLTFALGHGFDRDPLYPWISRILEDERVADPEKRAERLRAKATAYLGRALGFLESQA